MAGQVERRRSLRSLSLRALGILRHHYFSFVTAAVLIAISVVAVRSTSFEGRVNGALRDGSTTTVDWTQPQRQSFSTRGRYLIYYIVESQEQAGAIHRAMRSDMVMSEQNGGRYDFGLVYYVQAGTPMEEGNVNRLLHTVVESAASTGTVVTIIDLRP